MPGDEPGPRADDADDLIGRLLVASPQLGDPNFERTVILVLDHGPEGALGVVLNRPTGLPVDEILDAWHDEALAAPPGVVFRGGPVSPDAVIGLARAESDEADESQWRLVLDGVGTVDLAIAPQEQPVTVAGVRMFAGYAGWSPEQLEGELAEGAWIVVEALISDIFTTEADDLWHDVLQRQGGKLALLAAYPPASLGQLMPGTVGNVVRAAPQDVGPLSAALARAFDDDPLSLYLFGGPRTRAAGLARFFTIQLRHTYLRHGEVWTTADRAGAALWAPPTMPRPGGMDLLRILPVVPYLSVWGRKTPDVVRLLAAYERARPRQAHWYLGTLGTDPDRQGQGVGSALLRVVLDRLDLEGIPAYLESSKERNLAFYSRHGFQVTGEITTPRGPTLWLMWREPRLPDL